MRLPRGPPFLRRTKQQPKAVTKKNKSDSDLFYSLASVFKLSL